MSGLHVCNDACGCVCVCACVRACERALTRACLHARARAFITRAHGCVPAGPSSSFSLNPSVLHACRAHAHGSAGLRLCASVRYLARCFHDGKRALAKLQQKKRVCLPACVCACVRVCVCACVLMCLCSRARALVCISRLQRHLAHRTIQRRMCVM